MSSPDRAARKIALLAANVAGGALLLVALPLRTAMGAPSLGAATAPDSGPATPSLDDRGATRAAESIPETPETSRQRLRAITEPGPFLHTWASLMFGDGLRFNNPYRLPHQLGESSESLSLTAPYVDVAIAIAAGNPTGLLHGGRLSWSVAMTGVPQGVVTPAYLVGIRPNGAWLLAAWAGVPLVTAPDFNVGGELAALATYFVRAGIGATAAIVADGFYGAGTRERRAALYPVVSAQLGISVDYEVLP